MTPESKHLLVAHIERLDLAMGTLSGEIAHLEERLRQGDKGAFKTAKFQRAQLLKLRQERGEIERRLRRHGL